MRRRSGATPPDVLRIVHVSDLHFGRDRPELLAPLTAAVNALEPGLVAVSGDLTQRARSGQFDDAARLVGAFAGPKLVVPGNHDVPLWNVAVRVARPFARYKKRFGPDLEPTFRAGDVTVLGVNSVDPLAWQRGLMTDARIDRARARLAGAPRGLRVVVMHHPLVHPPGSVKEPMEGAAEAARVFAEAGADVVLSGHLHSWSAEPFRGPEGGRSMLFVQAGTGLSTRLRGQENDFNVVEAAAGEVTVIRHVARADGSGFDPRPPQRFVPGAEGWERA